MYKDLTLESYLTEVSTPSGKAGGGAASALAAANAASLLLKAAGVSINRREREGAECPQLKFIVKPLEKALAELLKLCDDDAAAFASVLAAYKSGNAAQIRQSYIDACVPPLSIVMLSADIANYACIVMGYADKIITTDVAIAAQMAYAAARGAGLLLALNAKGITPIDKELQGKFAAGLKAVRTTGRMCRKVMRLR